MGDILGGGRARSPVPAPELAPFEAKPQAVREHHRAGSPKLPSPSATHRFLESNLLLGPPRPWGAAVAAEKGQFAPPEKGHSGLMMPKWYPHEAVPALPAEMLRVEQEAAGARLAARLAACERRVEGHDADKAHENETLQRVMVELRQVREGLQTHSKISEERIIGLESGLERSRREDAMVREHISVLQKDFREFAADTVGRQRAELEHEVSNAFMRQNAATEEWRGTMRQRDSQVQAEIQRLSNSVEDASSELVRAQAELRTRISGLEAGRLAGRDHVGLSVGRGGDAEEGGGHMVDYLRQQVDALRHGSDQVGARLSELWARCEGEAMSQQSLKQDAEMRFVSLSKAITTERDNLGLHVSQRLAVLESRLGVERSEVNAKQAELHDQVINGDNRGISHVQDVASRQRSEVDAVERRLQGELTTLRVQIEADIAQLASSRVTDEEAHRSSLASMLQRFEGSTHAHAEASNNLRQEIDISIRDLRQTFRAEATTRTEAERKFSTDAGTAAQTLATELGSLQVFVQKQAESVAAELDRMRFNGTDRADRLSRYVDEKVAMISGGNSNSHVEAETAAIEERLVAVKAAAEEQARSAEQRVEACAEDLRTRMRQAEEVWMREAASTRRESDRSTTAAERRLIASQDELKSRFEAYVKHFDSAIASVQAAVLRPLPIGAQEAPRPPVSPTVAKPMPAGRRGLVTGWASAGAAAPAQELRSVLDGLRVHEEPDLASQVRGSLARGETVTVKEVFERDKRRWANLGGLGGFVLAFSEGGTPLLEPLPTPGPALPPDRAVAPAQFGNHGGVGAASAVVSPSPPWERVSPTGGTGESVRRELAEEVASSACRLEFESEDQSTDLQDMVRGALSRGVASGDFARALELEQHEQQRDSSEARHSPEQVLCPAASPARQIQNAPGDFDIERTQLMHEEENFEDGAA